MLRRAMRGLTDRVVHAAVQPRPGQVTMFFGEDELNAILEEFGEKLVIVEASMTWCRPCKGFERAYEVRSVLGESSQEYCRHFCVAEVVDPMQPVGMSLCIQQHMAYPAILLPALPPLCQPIVKDCLDVAEVRRCLSWGTVHQVLW